MKIFMTIVVYVLYFFFYSAVGWLGESIYCSVGARKWVNRGFLKGPMCPIYGTGALAMAITLTPRVLRQPLREVSLSLDRFIALSVAVGYF